MSQAIADGLAKSAGSYHTALYLICAYAVLRLVFKIHVLRLLNDSKID